jgi:hypothetical protein
MLTQWNRPVAAHYAKCAVCPIRASPQGQLITQHNGQPLASSIKHKRHPVDDGPAGWCWFTLNQSDCVRLWVWLLVMGQEQQRKRDCAVTETTLKKEEAGAALSTKQANRKCVGFLRRNFTRESINQPLYCCCFDLLR